MVASDVAARLHCPYTLSSYDGDNGDGILLYFKYWTVATISHFVFRP